jgi:amidase
MENLFCKEQHVVHRDDGYARRFWRHETVRRHGSRAEFVAWTSVIRWSFMRGLSASVLAALAATACQRAPITPPPPPFEVVEADIETMQRAMTNGDLSARQLSEMYLRRTAALNATLHAIIETNPDALTIADQLDAERRTGHVRGALHGIPILVKDTIETHDRMETAAGSLAMVGIPVSADAFVVERLRAAGAIVFGKANLTEWAGAGAQLGWSSRGGQTGNPYGSDRSPLGSSAGSASAVAANLIPAALGGETVGSIAGPASVMGVVGLKTTAGLVSRRGTVPAVQSIDSIGPIARTVRDAAIVLTAVAAPDEGDPQSAAGIRPPATDYAARLGANGLRGVRLGIVREASLSAETVPMFDKALDDLRALGAVLVDAELPADFSGQKFDGEFGAWFFGEFNDSLSTYFTTRRPNPRIRGVDDILAANRRLASPERPIERMGQQALEMAAAARHQSAGARRRAAATITRLSDTKGLEPMLASYAVEGFVSSVGPAVALNGPPPELPNMIALASLSGGAPLISVPMGQVNHLPVGLLFISRRWSDASLLQWAYAYEQRTHHRAAPPEPPHAESK